MSVAQHHRDGEREEREREGILFYNEGIGENKKSSLETNQRLLCRCCPKTEVTDKRGLAGEGTMSACRE